MHDSQVQHWLDRLAAGVPEARGELIRHTQDRLLHLTRLMLNAFPGLRRWEQTDDVYQAAVLRLHRALHEVNPGTVRELLGLARECLRRELIDLHRHYFGPEGLGRHYVTPPGGKADSQERKLLEPVQDTFNPSSLEEWAEFHDEVNKLPEEVREVFHLRWYLQFTFEEIGSILGVSDRTAKRRWRDACLLLHERFRRS
jgi:RNA polymerase sigma-70 factor (ECF subfamily)